MTQLNIHQRLNAVMKEVESIEHDSSIKLGGREMPTVSHDAVAKKTHMPFAKHGILCYPTVSGQVSEGIDRVDVCFVNVDEPANQVCISVNMPRGTTNQNVGALLTYATKDAILKVLMIASGDYEELVTQKEPEVESLQEKIKLMKRVEVLFKSLDYNETQAMQWMKKIGEQDKIIKFLNVADDMQPKDLKTLIDGVLC